MAPARWLFLVALLATGCMNNGIEWSELSFTRSRPRQADLVGTWTPTAKTRRDMKGRGRYSKTDAKLILAADGTCSVVDMPDWWRGGFGESHRLYESGQGKWRIEEEKDVGTIYVLGLELPEGHQSVHLSRQKPPYQLHLTLGDPDSGNYMLFERETPEILPTAS